VPIRKRMTIRVGVVVSALAMVALSACSDESDASSDEQDERREEGRTDASSDGAEAAAPTPDLPELATVDVPQLDTSAANRRAPIAALPDWSHAGYRGGAGLPGDGQLTGDEACRLTPDELAGDFGVTPDDGTDDSQGLQQAIDTIADDCSPHASYDTLSLITLPAGVVDVSRQISVDADYLVIRGAGADPAGGTRIVFAPDEDTRYDSLDDDGSAWDPDGMQEGDGKGGWIWPGRGVFRVQSRQVHEDYVEDYEDAPANRRDLFEGTVNVHWTSGATLRGADGDPGFSARQGDTVVHLDDDAALDTFTEGGYVNIRAANSLAFYETQEALPTNHDLQNLHMRQQIFEIVAVDAGAGTITLDKPLEFDLPVDSTSDGSDEIEGDTYESKAAPLVDPVLGVGIESLHITQVAPEGVTVDEAAHNYGNLAPDQAMHGIVLKWTVNAWVRGITTYMPGSHPVVTEEARNIEIVGNHFEGSWNKGRGGNGYLRGSRVWDSLWTGNTLRGLRHLTLQWSASGNVVIGNDLDGDLNLHGGWERNNLFELNTVRVPYEHRPGNCETNCGGEGGEGGEGGDSADESAWFPIWWGAGRKAVKWSGASGPQNVFFNNTLAHQVSQGGEYAPYLAAPGVVQQFGWDGSGYAHLERDGEPITDWAGNEEHDFSGAGVDTSLSDPGPSLFLTTVPG
jgi:hypothetical protein